MQTQYLSDPTLSHYCLYELLELEEPAVYRIHLRECIVLLSK
ncbi:hypothetical protein EFW58_01687 [Bacillus velezensis]|nr:hypothetical protein EFW58_01687 [Bacillus velezensis]